MQVGHFAPQIGGRDLQRGQTFLDVLHVGPEARELRADSTQVLKNRIAGRSVPDEAYEAVRRHFSEDEVIALSVVIANIDGWNRLGAAFRFAPPIPKKVESKAA